MAVAAVTPAGKGEVHRKGGLAQRIPARLLRTGLEDTFYLPSGRRASGNGELVEALVGVAREAGREIASPEAAREVLLRP